MVTITGNRVQMENTIHHAVLLGARVDTIMHSGPLLVVRVAKWLSSDTRAVLYFASTHWGDEALLLRQAQPHFLWKDGRPVRNDDGERGPIMPHWSSGGICEDATAEQIAQVMIEIWTDALRQIEDGMSIVPAAASS